MAIGESNLSVRNGRVASNLSLANFAGVSYDGPGLPQALYEGGEGGTTNQKPSARNNGHYQCPKGHVLLGLQIAIGVIAGLIGANRLRNAATDSFSGSKGESAGFGYVLGGMALIGVSALLIITIVITADVVLPIRECH
jgi:hypothetical protein